MGQESNPELESEMEFLSAMSAFRSARASGDAEAIADAEEAWRRMIRDELRAKGEDA